MHVAWLDQSGLSYNINVRAKSGEGSSLSSLNLTDFNSTTFKERLKIMNQSKLMALLADKKKSMKKSARTVKLKAGNNRVRLLPGWRKDEPALFFHDFGQHFIKDAANQLQAIYLCTDATFGKTCEVCSALGAAGNAARGDDDLVKVLADSRASKSILVNALMLDSEEPNTPVILELRPGVFGKIIEILEEWEGSPLDPENGQEIIISRNGTGLTTKYDAQISPKKFKVPAAALTQLNDLDEYVAQESEENKRKAIAAVSTVAGILPAPARNSRDTPTTSAARLAAPADSDFDDIPDFDEVPAPAAAPAAVQSAAPSVDTDLDALLDDL